MNQQASHSQNDLFPAATYKLVATYQLGTPQEELSVHHQMRHIIAGIFLLGLALLFASGERPVSLRGFSLKISLYMFKKDFSLASFALILLLLAIYCLLYPLFYRCWHL